MPGRTILQQNTAFMDTAANMWRTVVEKSIMPINPSLPDCMKTSSRRHGSSDQYAVEYWKARRKIDRVINAMRIDPNGDNRHFVKAVARQHLFDHTSCSVYFGNGSRITGISFVHLLKSRDGTFRTPQATFMGEAGARMAAANIFFFNCDGISIPASLIIYANRTITNGHMGVAYRGLESLPSNTFWTWEEQGCTPEEMCQVPTRAQKRALREWFSQRKYEAARRRIARVLSSDAYARIRSAATAHESWKNAAFSGLHRTHLEYVYRPWRTPGVLDNGATTPSLPYLAYPLSKERMAVGIPKGTGLTIDGLRKPGVYIIRSGAILERGAQRLCFAKGKLMKPTKS